MNIGWLTSPCLLWHSGEWTYLRVDGQLTRACSRCLQPLTAILADRGRDEDIRPAKVPPILVRHAQIEKVKRTRKRRPAPVLVITRKSGTES